MLSLDLGNPGAGWILASRTTSAVTTRMANTTSSQPRVIPLPPPYRPYLLAAGAVALGVAARFAVDPHIGDNRLPFFTLFPAVFYAAWAGGLGPALLASALSALVVWGLLQTATRPGAEPDLYAFVSLGLFAAIGAACGYMGQARLDQQAAAANATALAREQAARAQEEAARAESEAVRAEEEASLAKEERLHAKEEAARAEAALSALRESESRFKALADGAPVLIWVNGLNGCEFVNQPYLEFVGVPATAEVSGYDWAQYVHPDDRDTYLQSYMQSYRARSTFDAQFRFRRRDGVYRWMKSFGQPRFDGAGTFLGYVGSSVDVSDMKEAEAQLRTSEERLRQSAKMEAIGRLAGGLAHDFNNQLHAVVGFADFVSRDSELTPRAHQDLLQLQTAVERMAGLTRQLLAFSRQQVLTPETLDLNIVISEVEPMLLRLIGGAVEVRVELGPDALWVRVDRSQVTQVLLNLAINARDAMPDGGEVHLRTGVREVPAGEPPLGGATLPRGRYAELQVRDTGSGIPAEHLPQIFDPFFTTKPVGHGTGLGLATVHGIVSQSGGHVWATSDGPGATFTVLLPLAEAPAAQAPAEPARVRPSGPARILVVDDEDLVRSVIVRSLEEAGYVVYEARNGREALDRLAAEQGRIDLVVSDLVMPVMSGKELARELARRHAGLPVVWISGYTREPDLRSHPQGADQPFLQKPVAPSLLHETVGQILSRDATGAG